MALAIASSTQIAFGNSVPATTTYSASANELLILLVAGEADGGYMPVTSVSDGTLTYTRRGKKQVRCLNVGSGQAEYVDLEIWWAFTGSAFTGRTLTVNFDTSASSAHRNIIGIMSHVTGVQNTSAPWDNGASAFNDLEYAHASTKLASPSVNTTTAQANSMALGFTIEYESSGSGVISTAGSGFTSINTLVRGLTPNRAWITAEQKAVATAGAVTTSRGDVTGKLTWILLADALSGTSTGSSSDTSITTDTGTITSSFSKMAQSLTGTETTSGSITSSFSKMTQSLTSTEKISGTISTALSRFAQTMNEQERFSGAITTSFGRFAQTVNAQEKISGSAATSLFRFNESGAVFVGSEIFSGPIVTNLFGMAQSLTGDEIIEGDLGTHFGGVSGQMLGNSAIGEVIIQGPIEMHFGGISQVLAGSSHLGTAGNFYSWYHTDS